MARTVWENEERGEQERRNWDHGELQQKGETRLIARRLPEVRQLDCINCQGLQAELDRGTLAGGGVCGGYPREGGNPAGEQAGNRLPRRTMITPKETHGLARSSHQCWVK